MCKKGETDLLQQETAKDQHDGRHPAVVLIFCSFLLKQVRLSLFTHAPLQYIFLCIGFFLGLVFILIEEPGYLKAGGNISVVLKSAAHGNPASATAGIVIL